MKETSYRLIVLQQTGNGFTQALLRYFIAKYRATGRRVTGGIANAQAWFSLTYQ